MHNIKKLSYILLIAILLVGCGQREQLQQSAIFTDDYGREIEVPAHPLRIVSASPAVTEIICALGGENLLVGRTDYCKYPLSVDSIESIGGITNLNVEKILSLQPDIVIAGSMIPERSAQQLQEMGVPIVCVIEKQSFNDLYDNIEKIGQLIDHTTSADSLINNLKKALDSALYQIDSKESKTAYYAVGYGKGGNYTAGGKTFINDIMTMAGLENIASDLEGWEYSLEMLMQKNPDYVIIRREDSAAFCQMQPYSTLNAVKNNRVIGIESGIIDLQVPRNVDAILYINQIINNK